MTDQVPRATPEQIEYAVQLALRKLPGYLGQRVAGLLIGRQLASVTNDVDRLTQELLSLDTALLPPREPHEPLNAAVVEDWAIGTLQEWMSGYSSPQEDVPQQYRVKPQDDGSYVFEPLDHPDYSYRELPTQRFTVDIRVTEVSE